MDQRITHYASLLLAVIAGDVLTDAARAADKPNVLVIYADDLGWGELSCQGSKDIPTPNIDSIAANGIRFTQGYVAATYCSPSRAGLMTGRYPTRFGHENRSARSSRPNAICFSTTELPDSISPALG